MGQVNWRANGRRFGHLTVRGYLGVSGGAARWACLCDCGEVRVTTGNSLRSGKCRSCGCLQRERARAANSKGGMKVPGSEAWALSRIRAMTGTVRVTAKCLMDAYEKWDGRCVICRAETSPPHCDHCHNTGKFRGFLCGHCNKALGLAGDDPSRLRRMADYVSDGV